MPGQVSTNWQLQFDPQQWDFAELADHCISMLARKLPLTMMQTHVMPTYANRFALSPMMMPDLAEVAQQSKMSEEHLIELFQKVNLYRWPYWFFTAFFLFIRARYTTPPATAQ